MTYNTHIFYVNTSQLTDQIKTLEKITFGNNKQPFDR